MANKSTTSEASIEKCLSKEVRAVGGWCLKLPAVFDSGIPDRLCLFPRGKAIFVELKAPGKKPRRLQEIMHKRLRSLGFRVEVVDNKAQAKALAQEYRQHQDERK